MKITLLIIGMALVSFSIAIPCTAPVGNWGPPCVSPYPLAGVKGTYINYHVTVYAATTVKCQAVGMSNYTQVTKCAWGWHELGVVNNIYVSLIWDTQNSYPSIRCMASPYPSQLDWTYSNAVSALTCMPRDPFRNKISFDSQDDAATLFE